MAVYVDAAVWPWRGTLWCHLLADDLDELHLFARRLSLERRWFQHPPKASSPHYDLTPGKRAQAVALGAVEIDRRTTVIKARALRTAWQAQNRPSAPTTGSKRPSAGASGSETGAQETVPPPQTAPKRSVFPFPGRRG